MRSLRPLPLLAAAALAPLLAACGHRDRSDVKVSFDQSRAAAAAAEPLGPGDVRVTSTDGAFVLALVGDSVRMQLSDSLRDKVKRDLDTNKKDGFAGMITRSVSGIVGSAMGFVVRIPVRDIQDVRYEDGHIKFDTRGDRHVSINGSKNNESSAKFSPEDGARFVAAVKARQAQLR